MSQDPLDTNVADINTDYPVIPAALYELSVAEAVSKQNKAQTGDNIVVTFKTTQPCSSTKGQQVPAGFIINHNISTVPTEKYTNEMIARAIATLCKAAGVSCTPRELIGSPALLTGKVVRAKVGTQPEGNGFAEKNVIKSFVIG